MTIRALLLALAAAVVSLGSACTSAAVPAGPAPPATATYQPEVPAGTVHAGVCSDPSSSAAPGFAEHVRDALAAAVDRTPGPAGPPGAPTAPRSGLDLHVRTVGSASGRTDQPFLNIQVEAVPGLVARPDSTDPDFLDIDPHWVEAAGTVEEIGRRAASQEEAGARAIQGMALDRSQRSDIWGCVAALAQIVERPARFVVATDLVQNVPYAFRGDLRDVELLIVQACEQQIDRCGETVDVWVDALVGLGAKVSDIEVIRPESAAEAIIAFLSGEPS